jgi:iron complex outermembrane receptor protein
MRLRIAALGVLVATALVGGRANAQEITVSRVPSTEPPEERPREVAVHATPPARSASDWEVDRDTLTAAPHADGADLLDSAPGMFVTERALLGQAPHLSLRGFDGTAGQDVEIFVGNLPMNQVSNIRAPGYADMRLVMPEVVKSVRVSNGPYDPRQGDFAVAGSVHMDLGLEAPGFWGKGALGSFGSRRVYLAYAPEDREWSNSFAAFDAYGTDGVGVGHGGQRGSFVGQLAFANDRVDFKAYAAAGTARFDFPGFLSQSAVEQGAYPYGANLPLGRDRSALGALGAQAAWRIDEGTLAIGAFAAMSSMELHQDLTGYALDVQAGGPPANADDREQTNGATTVGLDTSYRHLVKLTSKRDSLELGTYARLDTVDQSDTRLLPDGTRNGTPLVDATIHATNVAAYVDASLYPIRRLVLRGGTRLDSLSYSVTDRTTNQGLDRTAQGFHVGNKATADYALRGDIHLVASYGEGFRSPQARDLAEGQTVPFATVRSVEAGVRVKRGRAWQASLAGFQSWLSQDRVFDAFQLQSAPAPSSSRTGVAATTTVRWGVFGASVSATYTHAVFTASDAQFQSGTQVPYAPAVVLRDDTFVAARLGTAFGHPVQGRIGVGLEGAAGIMLPGGAAGKNVFYADALARVAWRQLELGLNAMNIFDLRYYDAQYVYVSNFQRSSTLPAPSSHVIVAPPASVFVTLQIHLQDLFVHRGWSQ